MEVLLERVIAALEGAVEKGGVIFRRIIGDEGETSCYSVMLALPGEKDAIVFWLGYDEDMDLNVTLWETSSIGELVSPLLEIGRVDGNDDLKRVSELIIRGVEVSERKASDRLESLIGCLEECAECD